MKIVISGASGFLGGALAALLRARGDQVQALVRPASQGQGIRWDPAAGSIDAAALEGADALVHLAGEGIASRRWSEAQKQRIKQSRIDGTLLLARTLSALRQRPSVWVCASAVGIYGDRGDEPIDERSAPGTDFLAEVGTAWEQATQPAVEAGVRVVLARLGVVLDPSGGALQRMLLPFRLGVGGALGSGKQYMSWIARVDAVRALVHALSQPALSGPVNVTAPNPVTNEQFTRALGAALHRPTVMRVPGFAARAAFGELAQAALLSGARVLPRRLLESGFTFEQPELAAYLRGAL